MKIKRLYARDLKYLIDEINEYYQDADDVDILIDNGINRKYYVAIIKYKKVKEK